MNYITDYFNMEEHPMSLQLDAFKPFLAMGKDTVLWTYS
jgi:hypothetical protein